MKRVFASIFSLAFSYCAVSPSAFAWGERGHDGVTRVATRLLADSKDPETAKFGAFLQRKENMLGHLANVPDIVWRSLGPELDKSSSPSHFVDMEYILPPGSLPKAADLPQNVAEFLKALDANCAKKSKDVPCDNGKSDDERLQKSGHAPFRIETLSQDLVQSFKEMKSLEAQTGDNGAKRDAVIERVILTMGILSHFVGDLSNPEHTAKDYDAWDLGQGGLHGYFESEIVDSLPLDLEAVVLDEAQRHQPMAERFARHPHNYLQMAWELALDSHEKLPLLEQMDRQYSLLEKSVSGRNGEGGHGKGQKAKRRDALETRGSFRNLIILRLAAGADALSRIWLDTWQQGGKPDMSFYHSYHYDVKPDFIPLRYLPHTKS
ncbi:MAG: hypothetical protein H7249_19430 [Chitinophagaceae bacterium]|nr:hypothetical protein [Oligoflexus sp.]